MSCPYTRCVIHELDLVDDRCSACDAFAATQDPLARAPKLVSHCSACITHDVDGVDVHEAWCPVAVTA